MSADRRFGVLLRRAARLSRLCAESHRELDAAFRERYGVTYADIEADHIIESIDYGDGQGLSVRECDAIMAEHGHPRVAAA